MAILRRRLVVAALAGLAVWALTGSPAHAQRNPLYQVGNQPGNMGNGQGGNPFLNNSMNQAAMNQAAMGQPAAPFLGFNGARTATLTSVPTGTGAFPSPSSYFPPTSGYDPYYNPYMSPYGGYYNPYYNQQNPVGDNLRGAAAAMDAYGRNLIMTQDARVRFEQWQQARIQTRRAIFDEWLYEQANRPSVQDVREAQQRLDLRRALNNPPVGEVLSASALNNIVKDLQTKQAQGAKGTPYNIDENVLKQINLTSLSTPGNIGMLKNIKDSGLPWPLPLRAEAYNEETTRLNRDVVAAVRMAEFKGQVDPGTLKGLIDEVGKLKSKVSANIDELTPTQSIEANRFLNQLDSALRALQAPDVASYFNQQFMARGKTVPDLLNYLQSKGLTIAPAAPGDEAAYVALHNLLVSYANSLQMPNTGGNGP
jgi:hypothetical protein